MVTRGFSGRRPTADIANRLPPGQFKTDDFPVLSKGPVPRIDLAAWRFTLSDGPRPLKSWSWNEFLALPRSVWEGDIHCVTTWSKFDTRWEGVTIDALLADAGIAAPTPWLLALSLVWCLKSKHQIMVLAARATDAKMVSALLCHTNGLGSSL